MNKAKSFDITKRSVWEAYKHVKANKGVAGIDKESIATFEGDLKNNLYKIWNRMSSGSYIPPSVQLVEIPKSDGKKRKLGIPTVADRIAQMVAKIYLEPQVEPIFHEDSYGYRPKKSALDAVAKARQRCWKYNWVIDLDIKGFFDNLDHDLMLRAVKKHTSSKWLLLYINRWLKAPVSMQDGTLQKREKGTAQGGVISPLLANLFLHYTLDVWMEKHYPNIPFERYADDIICHCRTEQQAKELLVKIEKRLSSCGLSLHPEKTRIVYCKDDKRKGEYANVSFNFLGFTFKPRETRTKAGRYFVGFNPAVSCKAKQKINSDIATWEIPKRISYTLEELARIFNPKIRGWINYYGSYNKSVLNPIFMRLEEKLVRLVMNKSKRIKGLKRAWRVMETYRKQTPRLYAHWKLLYVEKTKTLRAV